ncbi:hypothetical protein [Psychrobacter sp.]|uniref:hypothetical protein n=1 Tax=Psychrobacter sp. TaxID=56811 RepID=UPI003C71DACC
MSFLNPVNEPVLRFKSTDAGAPQINYSARVAGDVKAIIKACLVTGYGTTASAGWSVVNEVDHVAEFVSPSAAMSDYRLGIDDTSTSNTTWYYQYQDARVNPASNTLTKNFSNINKTSVRNGWQLLATDQGFIFIEVLDDNIALGLVTRVTYWGRVKSALKNDSGKNIAWWSVGHNAFDPTAFFNPDIFRDGSLYISGNRHHVFNGSYGAQVYIIATNAVRSGAYVSNDPLSAVEIVSAWYFYSQAFVVGVQPGVLLADCNDDSERFKVSDTMFNGRPVLSVPISYATGDLERYNKYTRTLLLALDNWEY